MLQGRHAHLPKNGMIACGQRPAIIAFGKLVGKFIQGSSRSSSKLQGLLLERQVHGERVSEHLNLYMDMPVGVVSEHLTAVSGTHITSVSTSLTKTNKNDVRIGSHVSISSNISMPSLRAVREELR